ncbi:MAG: hypothetical protein NTV86_19845 [Planctomycetota bacterium]|nr:hypothetical protein [Planctomycetota bacterium]
MTTGCTIVSGMMAVALGTACLALAGESEKPAILPTPKSIKLEGGTMPLTAGSRIVVTDPRLEVHAPVLAQEIWLITGMRPAIVKEGDRPDQGQQLDRRIRRQGPHPLGRRRAPGRHES